MDYQGEAVGEVAILAEGLLFHAEPVNFLPLAIGDDNYGTVVGDAADDTLKQLEFL